MIDRPGTYRARNGETVIIERILAKGATPCVGRISRTCSTGKQRWVSTLWGTNGRQFKLHEHNEDVVEAIG